MRETQIWRRILKTEVFSKRTGKETGIPAADSSFACAYGERWERSRFLTGSMKRGTYGCVPQENAPLWVSTFSHSQNSQNLRQSRRHEESPRRAWYCQASKDARNNLSFASFALQTVKGHIPSAVRLSAFLSFPLTLSLRSICLKRKLLGDLYRQSRWFSQSGKKPPASTDAGGF